MEHGAIGPSRASTGPYASLVRLPVTHAVAGILVEGLGNVVGEAFIP